MRNVIRLFPVSLIINATLLCGWFAGTAKAQFPLASSDGLRRFSDTAIRQETVREEERNFTNIAALVPGFSGFFYDQSGDLIVLATNKEDGERSRALVMALLRTKAILPGAQSYYKTTVVTRLSKYTFVQLAQWRDYIGEHLDRDVFATSLDLDEARNRITIGVNDASEEAQNAFLVKLAAAGVDSMAVAFEKQGAFQFDVGTRASQEKIPLRLDVGEPEVLKKKSPPATLSNQSSDPIPGGMLVNRPAGGGVTECTLGFVARLYSSYIGYVSNSHCSPTVFGVDYTSWYQLYYSSSYRQVATEALDPAYYSCGIYGCRASDAAFNLATDSTYFGLGKIARTSAPTVSGQSHNYAGSTTLDISDPYFYITGASMTGAPTVGAVVHKMGAITGWTKGVITGTCVDHFVGYSAPATGLKMRCGYEADYWADHGDSGSPVFYFEDQGVIDGNPLLVKLLGIHTGRADSPPWGNNYARFNPIGRIESDLGSLGIALPATLSIPSLSGSVSGGTAVIAWSAISGASSYDVYVTDYYLVCVDPDWPCNTEAYSSTRYSTTSTSFTDTRGFYGQITPPRNDIAYSQYEIKAFNATTGAYSTMATIAFQSY